MTFPPAAPGAMRAVSLEVSYDGLPEPSLSVPALDFFGVPHGRPVPHSSVLTSMQEGRGFNSYFPIPFAGHLKMELTNGGSRPIDLFYQVDYTVPVLTGGSAADHRRPTPPDPQDASYLHASFRPENPTALRRDFVIVEGLRGPGRFLGCVVGVRVLDWGVWYGEGEVKVFRDGDTDLPTICGTGLEDYVGSAWGMGPHHALYAGAPLEVRVGDGPKPQFVGFYRWHVPDPIVFSSDLRITIQQIGYCVFSDRFADKLATWEDRAAGRGYARDPQPGVKAMGIAEREDDYCATSFVYCRSPQAVPRLDVAAAVADLGRLPGEPGP